MEGILLVKQKEGILLFLFLAFIFTLIFLPSEKRTEKYVTKIVTKDDLYWLERNQRELANDLREENQSLSDEMLKAAIDMYSNLDIMVDNPHYNQLEIKLPLITYEKNGETIEFFTGKGEILRVHTKDGWSDYK